MSFDALDDSGLVELSIKGNHEAFEYLIRRYQDYIFRLSYRLIGNEKEAKDLSIDVFAEAYRMLQGFQKKAQFKTWLYRIALNMNYAYLRKKISKRQREENIESELHTYEAEINFQSPEHPRLVLNQKETELQIRKVLSRLSRKDAEILILCEVEGLSYAQISDILHCPEGTVMSRLNRARARFRDLWNAHLKSLG